MPNPAPSPVGGPPPVPGYDTSATTPQTGGSTGGVGVANAENLQVGNYTISLVNGIKSSDMVQVDFGQGGYTSERGGPNYDTVGNVLQKFANWSNTDFQKFRLQAYQAGLIPSKTASKAEVLVAWQTVVEEAVKEKLSPTELIQKAVDGGGWNSLQPTINPSDNGLAGTGNANSLPEGSTTQTTYVSYLDPATIQGAQADAWYRLLGRNPTSQEYQDFMQQVYGYQGAENTGKFETTDKTAQPGAGPGGGPGGTDTMQNIISQRGIGQRGLQFLAGQAAMSNPEEGMYQAATTYFNAFMKALAGPAAGMQASGPTIQAP